ncbi:MAG TPA: glycoside hydrolase family 3 N-terminal domain-containing protein [Longimicrobiaceae bacterium]|nr:glycoside hydrolase family 3 N-terminal domain-containing protein [Longimicrobiaceae bacterium]
MRGWTKLPLVLLVAAPPAGCAAAPPFPAPAPTRAPDTRLEARVDSVLALMTLQEKAGQLSITGGRPDLDSLVVSGALGGTNGVLPGKDVARYTQRMQRLAMRSRLRIPLTFMGDVIHGFRTTLPVPLAMAATWDTALVRRAEHMSAVEAAAAGVNWTFAPMLDVARDPRWGRVVESPGEDPFLGAAMARAEVTGFQGDSLGDPTSLAATAKHFAGYGAVEAGRDYNTVDVSERRFREVYLPTFHAAVDTGVATIMAAFTALDGVPATADPALLRGILRSEWGFGGVVVSDYDAIPELIDHRVAADTADAVALAMNAGVDVDLHSMSYWRYLPGLVREGRVGEDRVDEAVRRVLRMKFRLGLFDDPFRHTDPAHAAAVTLTPATRAVAREVARASMVLLKNQGDVLPLRKDVGTLAVLGPLADDSVEVLGPVHAQGVPRDTKTILQGIRERVAPGTRVLYAPGAGIDDTATAGFAGAVRLAGRADAAVVVLGERGMMSGEASSRSRLDLPGVQRELLAAILRTGTPTVVVLVNGRPLAIPWVAEHAPAILEAWLPGTEAGSAVADVLFGDYNPSGRLTASFPRDVGQIPIYYGHLSTGRPAVATDRYTSKYLDVPNSPLYPFGYGLSYTTYSFSNVRLSRERIAPGDSLTATVTVTNTGKRAGEEVVQMYVRDEVASIARPVRELRGFRKIALQPGESKDVSFRITPADLGFYGADMNWVVEPGWFTVFIGGDSNAREHARFLLGGGT